MSVVKAVISAKKDVPKLYWPMRVQKTTWIYKPIQGIGAVKLGKNMRLTKGSRKRPSLADWG